MRKWVTFNNSPKGPKNMNIKMMWKLQDMGMRVAPNNGPNSRYDGAS